jgi:hypothetical protein
METVKTPFEQAVRSALDGAIVHAPSCVLILKARLAGRL